MIGNICKLRDVCKKIGSGSTPKGGSLIYLRDGIGFIRSQNVYNNFFEYSGYAHISDAAAAKLSSVEVYENDVLLNITGDSVARCCLVPKEALPARVNQHVAIIRADNRILNPRFLMYYMISPEMQAIMLGLAVGKGASRNALTKGLIEDFDIPLPDIATQNKIVELLSAYDTLIENNRKQIKLLEEAARRLYKEWFVDLRFPGHEHTPIVNGIPEGWRRGELSSIASFVRGKTITQAKTLPGCIPVVAGGLTPAYYHNTANTRPPVITVSASGANAGYVALYHTPIWASDCSFIDSTKSEHLYYLYCLLKEHQAEINNFRKGSAQPHVHPNQINGLQLLVPHMKFIRQFEQSTAALFGKIRTLNTQNELLTEARDRLLPKLMSGEIAIK